jgi:hypothetical protein
VLAEKMRAVGVVRSVGTGVSCNPTVSSTAFTLRLSPNFDHHIRLDRPQAQPGRHAPPMRGHPAGRPSSSLTARAREGRRLRLAPFHKPDDVLPPKSGSALVAAPRVCESLA